MAKLFLFAIGGTGSRVVKALTMLLASGVELRNVDRVVPIIIDPDTSNGDLTRTVDMLKTYKEIREKTHSEESGFFKTKISSLDELGDGGFVSDNFRFDIDGVKEQLFKEFIGYSELERNSRAFISLLFSKPNLDADMDMGFLGNPNIGSVVLNKFKGSDSFLKFASNFEQEDRVFIISSIFGGTGAAGFPLILKNIRDAKHPTPHHSFLRDAKIGAVTVLPYFAIRQNDETTIDSNRFISKTKAALSYYSRNVSGNGAINALYYIGDQVTNEQEGADGSNKQRNRAHFIELGAALSIVDFMGLDDADLHVEGGRATDPKFFEFGLQHESSAIQFGDLAKETYDVIARPLTRYTLFQSLMENHYEELCRNKNEAWLYHGNNKLSEEALDSRLRRSLGIFNKHFREWLEEMANSNVAFRALDASLAGKDIYNPVMGRPAKKDFFKRLSDGAHLHHYRSVLSKLSTDFDHLNPAKKLVALFSHATKDITEKEIKL
jgi:hypothetical protein